MHSDVLLTIAPRLGADLLCLLVATGLLYRRRVAAPEMPLVFASLNLGLFATVVVIAGEHIPAGVGFGLFGLLSLVRLRSEAFTLQDMAYMFVALVLGLVNGLVAAPLSVVVAADVLLVAVLAIADESRSRPHTQVMRITLDRAYLDPAQVREAAAAQLPGSVVLATIEDVDHVRDTTRVLVRYTLDPTEAWTPEDLDGTTIKESDRA
jgi:hypothetical protein